MLPQQSISWKFLVAINATIGAHRQFELSQKIIDHDKIIKLTDVEGMFLEHVLEEIIFVNGAKGTKEANACLMMCMCSFMSLNLKHLL